MRERTAIEWTDATWTPIRARNLVTGKVGWHCEHASPGCANCYSENFNQVRLGTGLPFKPGHRADIEHFLDEKMLLAPLRWRRPRRIFVCSMTDLFGEWVPVEWIDRVFAVMALAPHHTFQVLTKRSARMRQYLGHNGTCIPVGIRQEAEKLFGRDPGPLPIALPNVWLGVSAEDQRRADERIPDLLATPAAVRFVSAEPLLGPVNLANLSTMRFRGAEVLNGLTGELRGMFGDPCSTVLPRLDWIIAGGESGHGARPMHPDWARSLRDQCAAAGVSFHFKQWGEWLDEAQASRQHCAPGPKMFDRFGQPKGDHWHPYEASDRNGGAMIRVGKARAGRLLDGIEHNGMPPAALRRAQGDTEAPAPLHTGSTEP